MNRGQLIEINGRFLTLHVLRESDFQMAENHISVIKCNHETCHTPQVGDLVEGAYYDGAFPYKYGIIEKIYDDGTLSICYEPYIPFIYVQDDLSISLSVSGGPFGSHKPEELVLVSDDDERMFCDWGSCGACANGAVNFLAPVRRWKIPYEWKSKTYVEVLDNPQDGTNPISMWAIGKSFSIASFRTMEQLDRFCKTLGITYTLVDETPGYRKYEMSHNFKDTVSFWKLEDVPQGCTPIKSWCNGNIVDCFFRTTEREVEIYRPNPNAKEVYKPLSLDEQRAYEREYGAY